MLQMASAISLYREDKTSLQDCVTLNKCKDSEEEFVDVTITECNSEEDRNDMERCRNNLEQHPQKPHLSLGNKEHNKRLYDIYENKKNRHDSSSSCGDNKDNDGADKHNDGYKELLFTCSQRTPTFDTDKIFELSFGAVDYSDSRNPSTQTQIYKYQTAQHQFACPDLGYFNSLSHNARDTTTGTRNVAISLPKLFHVPPVMPLTFPSSPVLSSSTFDVPKNDSRFQPRFGQSSSVFPYIQSGSKSLQLINGSCDDGMDNKSDKRTSTHHRTSFMIADILKSGPPEPVGSPLISSKFVATSGYLTFTAQSKQQSSYATENSNLWTDECRERTSNNIEDVGVDDDVEAKDDAGMCRSGSTCRGENKGTCSSASDVEEGQFPKRTRSSTSSPLQVKTKKTRKARTAFTDHQLSVLEKTFERQKYLNVQDRIELAIKLHLTDTQVKTWYQNRRTKWKRQTAVGLELLAEAGNYAAVQRILQTNPYWYNYHPQATAILSNLDAVYFQNPERANAQPERPLLSRMFIHGLQQHVSRLPMQNPSSL